MTTVHTPTNFYEVIKDRRAVKHYDASYEMSEQEIKELLQIANSAPSAYNLQHWKYLAMTEQPAKEKLLPIAYGQRQVVDASVVIAILGDLEAHRNKEAVYEPDAAAGLLPIHIKTNLYEQINDQYANVPSAPRDEAIRNASLAAMQLMLAAKAKGLDSGPIGGYDPAQLIETFNIPARYIPVMLVVIGKAAQPARPSSRFAVEETVVWNHF